MKTIPVTVTNEHIDRLAACKPMTALAELVWNSVDADATKTNIHFQKNSIGELDQIIVEDNGHGIFSDEVESNFGNLGGSWKRNNRRSRGKSRRLHGQAGQGRFRVFALGHQAEWQTFVDNNSIMQEYSIIAERTKSNTITTGDIKPSTRKSTGTVVTISNILPRAFELTDEKAAQELTELFALYMREYPDVHLSYNGIDINPTNAEESTSDFTINITLENDQQVDAQLTIIEWKNSASRAIVLCDEGGFYCSDVKPGVIAPGFNFTAYVKSSLIRELTDTNEIELGELHPVIRKLCDAVKAKLKTYFRRRKAERAAALVDKWKLEHVYPYEGVPDGPIEEAERQVFNICAMNINQYIPRFDEQNKKNIKLSFRLLRHAIEESPDAVRVILADVLGLSKEKQEEFAGLLKKTSLAGIINAAKIVSDRLDFINGLELLVFEEESRKNLKERKQLHKLLAENTWVFGEEFNLTVSDKSLDEVLAKHREIIQKPMSSRHRVRREDGSKGIVDLMLSRRIPQPRQEEREHLVVELKRPSRSINQAAVNQIESYAHAVATDERFIDTRTRWVFWVISNTMDDVVRIKVNQKDRPSGILHITDQYTIWAMTWGQIISRCRGRLEFFREQLDYQATRDSSRLYLTNIYRKYIPDHLLLEETDEDSTEGRPLPKTEKTKKGTIAMQTAAAQTQMVMPLSDARSETS